jgi:uncharacterized membrane protein
MKQKIEVPISAQNQDLIRKIMNEKKSPVYVSENKTAQQYILCKTLLYQRVLFMHHANEWKHNSQQTKPPITSEKRMALISNGSSLAFLADCYVPFN